MLLLLPSHIDGTWLAKNLNATYFSIVPSSGSIPTMLFIWLQTSFFTITEITSESISLIAYSTSPSFFIPPTTNKGKGPSYSSTNYKFPNVLDFSFPDRVHLLMGGEYNFTLAVQNFLGLFVGGAPSLFLLPTSLWSLGRRAQFLLVDRFAKASLGESWNVVSPHVLSFIMTGIDSRGYQSGFTLRASDKTWRIGYASRIKGRTMGLCALDLLREGLQKAHALKIKELEIVLDARLFSVAFLSLDAGSIDLEMRLKDLVQFLSSPQWEVSFRHGARNELPEKLLDPEICSTIPWGGHRFFDAPPSAALAEI